MKPVAAIVESVFDHAFVEINALEARIVRTDDEADALLWDQARRVVALLDAGLSQRQVAAQWINPRTGEPYSQKHVSFVARVYAEKLTSQSRPRFRDAYNAIANSAAPKQQRLLHQTGEVEWYSPADLVDAARDVLGAIDLDPASCAVANTVVRAAQIFTVADNGLAQPWRGRVFLNPPYKHPEIRQFCEKFAQHARAGDVTGVVLVNNATETEWFDVLGESATALCFPRSRCRYWQPDRDTSTALQGQVVVYVGPDPDRFHARFEPIGSVWCRYARTRVRVAPSTGAEHAE